MAALGALITKVSTVAGFEVILKSIDGQRWFSSEYDLHVWRIRVEKTNALLRARGANLRVGALF